MSALLQAAGSLDQTPPKHSSEPETLIRLAIPSFLYLLITYILPPPLPIRPEANLLDPSWQVVLTDGFLRAAQFGRDIVYTYGPWGFVESPRGDPRIYPWLLGARLLIAVAFVLGISLIAARGIRRPMGQFLFVAGTALLSDPVFVLPMVLLAAMPLHRSGARGSAAAVHLVTVHLLAIACALTMWIKFTSFVIVGALAGALAVQDLIKRRRPVIPLEILTASLAFWLLARQSLFGLPLFLRGAFSAALSYSAEMFLPGPYRELTLVAGLLLAMAIPAAALLYYRKPWTMFPSVLWVALLFSLQLKEAFVRYDPFHVWMGIVNALAPCVLILICRAGFFNPCASCAPAVRVLFRLCAACVVLLSVMVVCLEVPTRAGFERYQALRESVDSLKALAAGRSLSVDYRRQLDEFRRQEPLAPVPGTTDFFPDNQVMLYGNGLQPRMPPVPQAFEAYNSYLSGRNAAFFRGPNRPDFVFFDIAPIDARYPSAADSLSWLALMDCYRPLGIPGPWLVLRAAACRDASLRLVAETKIRAGDAVIVPSGDGCAIWVQIDLRLNRAGSIVAALARPPETNLVVDTSSGPRTFSISAGAARTGFLLSPLILDPAAFGRLIRQENADAGTSAGTPTAVDAGTVDPGTEVRRLEIVQSDSARRFYEPAMGVRFYKVVPRP